MVEPPISGTKFSKVSSSNAVSVTVTAYFLSRVEDIFFLLVLKLTELSGSSRYRSASKLGLN